MDRVRAYTSAVEVVARGRDRQLREMLAILGNTLLGNAEVRGECVTCVLHTLMNIYEEDVKLLRTSYLDELSEVLNEEECINEERDELTQSDIAEDAEDAEGEDSQKSV